MSGLALPPARLLNARVPIARLPEAGNRHSAQQGPARSPSPTRPPTPQLPKQGMARPAAIVVAPAEAAPRLPPVTRQRTVVPLALSLLGHAALLAAGVTATLLLPTTPPAAILSPPAFSIELTVAPTLTAPAQSTPAELPQADLAPVDLAPADLADVAPQPEPPPDALVVPQAADMAAALPAPEAPPAPLPVPNAVDMAAVLPAPEAPPAPVPVPSASDLAAVLTDPAAPPAPTLAPPPPPPRAQPAARPAHPAAAKPTVAKHAVARPASAQTTAKPVPPGPAAAPAAPAPPSDPTPLLIASPRFRAPPRPPVYPRRAIELRAQGEALIGALLDPTGAPHDLRVLRSSGHPMLDRAALDAVGGWAFEPGRRAGQPVAARVEIPVRFTLR